MSLVGGVSLLDAGERVDEGADLALQQVQVPVEVLVQLGELG